MKMEPMKTPKSRKEFERRMNILVETVREGKLVIGSNCTQIIESLTAVRTMGNGRLDFLTIDELARLQANMADFDMQIPTLDGVDGDVDSTE